MASHYVFLPIMNSAVLRQIFLVCVWNLAFSCRDGRTSILLQCTNVEIDISSRITEELPSWLFYQYCLNDLLLIKKHLFLCYNMPFWKKNQYYWTFQNLFFMFSRHSSVAHKLLSYFLFFIIDHCGFISIPSFLVNFPWHQE